MQANSNKFGRKILKYIFLINLLFFPLAIQAYIPPELSFAIQDTNDEPIDSMDFQTIFVGKLSTKTIRFKNESTHSLIHVSKLELGSCRPAGKITKHRAISIENQPYSVASPGLSLPIAISASSFEEVNLVFSPQNAGDFNADLCISYELLDGPTGELIGSSITYMTLSGTGAKLNTDENKLSLAEDDPLTQITTATLLFNNDENLAAHFKIERVEAVQGGSVVLNADQTISFKPNANYNGAASFNYVVKDDAGSEAAARVTGNINPVNDPPTLLSTPPNVSGSTPEDTPLTIPVSKLVENFTDPDSGDTLTIDSVSNPQHGTVTQNGGNVIFTPSKDFIGTASFDYTVKDSGGATIKATFTVTVTEVNDAPVLKPSPPNMSGSTLEDTALTIPENNLLSNFTDPDSGETLMIVGVSNPQNGTVTQSGGNLIFTPNQDFVGTGSFEYTIKDSQGATAKATFTVTVTEVNDAPVLKPSPPNMSGSTPEDTPLTIPTSKLVDNFTDPDSGDTLMIASVSNPQNGTASLASDGLSILFTPTPDFFGDAFFDYTVKDSNGATIKASFKIIVSDLDDALVVKGNNQTIPNGDKLPSAPDGTNFNEVIVSKAKEQAFVIENPNNAAITLNKIELREVSPNTAQQQWLEKLLNLSDLQAAGSGDFTLFTAVPLSIASKGSASFTIQFKPTATGLHNTDIVLTFSNDSSYSFRVEGTGVAAPASPPVVAKPIDPVTVNENAPATSLELKAVFTDPDNQALSLSIVSNTNSALVTPSLNGTVLSLAYAPNQSGTATITIRATAADGEVVETSFTVTVNPNSTTAIPIFSPLGLLVLLSGLFWLGRRFKH